MKEIEKDIFKELEIRLKLRALLARKKVEEYAKNNFNEKLELKLKNSQKIK